jgi:histone acetyltransferase (RNA polymerase elongator complex component)
MDEIVEFTPNSENIKTFKDLLKTQGYDVSRAQISAEFINKSFDEADFGLVRLTPRAIVGKKHTRKYGERYHVWGFILCSVKKPIATIQVVCARPFSTTTGKLLIEMAQETAKNKGATIIRLFSLSEIKLRNYYKNMGFQEQEVGAPGSEFRLYEMRKDL